MGKRKNRGSRKARVRNFDSSDAFRKRIPEGSDIGTTVYSYHSPERHARFIMDWELRVEEHEARHNEYVQDFVKVAALKRMMTIEMAECYIEGPSTYPVLRSRDGAFVGKRMEKLREKLKAVMIRIAVKKRDLCPLNTDGSLILHVKNRICRTDGLLEYCKYLDYLKTVNMDVIATWEDRDRYQNMIVLRFKTERTMARCQYEMISKLQLEHLPWPATRNGKKIFTCLEMNENDSDPSTYNYVPSFDGTVEITERYMDRGLHLHHLRQLGWNNDNGSGEIQQNDTNHTKNNGAGKIGGKSDGYRLFQAMSIFLTRVAYRHPRLSCTRRCVKTDMSIFSCFRILVF